MRNKIKQHSHKIIASMLSIFVLTIILFTGPAQAFILDLDIKRANQVNTGETITFTATLNIESMDKYLPIKSLMLNIGDKVCTFNLDGKIIGDNCNGVMVKKLSGIYSGSYGYGYGQDNSYGYDFGYGYGYGYGYGIGATELVYEITINTAHFNTGTHQAFLKAKIGDKEFTSKPKEITITQIIISSEDSSSNDKSSRTDGGCITNWECTEWSECNLNGTMTRTCTKVYPECFAIENKPIEILECSEDTINLQENIQDKNIISRITGAVIGGLRTTGGIIVSLFLTLTLGAFGVVMFRRRK